MTESFNHLRIADKKHCMVSALAQFFFKDFWPVGGYEGTSQKTIDW